MKPRATLRLQSIKVTLSKRDAENKMTKAMSKINAVPKYNKEKVSRT